MFTQVHAFVWGVSGLTLVPPLMTNSLGSAGEWCWIEGESKVGDAEHLCGAGRRALAVQTL